MAEANESPRVEAPPPRRRKAAPSDMAAPEKIPAPEKISAPKKMPAPENEAAPGNRPEPEDKAEPEKISTLPTIAAKADDLEAIKKAVEDAAPVSGGLWFSCLFVMFYIAVAAGAVTHVDLLLENPVKLPFLGVDSPLKAFFFLAPILFLVTHAYTMAHFRLLADKAKRFNAQLRKQIPGEYPQAHEIRAGLRRQLPSNIFVQLLAGPDETREGWFGCLLKTIVWTTLVAGPILLLLLLQLQFLPYHEAWITWVHRGALLADLLLVWWLWRAILAGRGDYRFWRWLRSLPAMAIGVVASVAIVLFSWTVATFPGEWRENRLTSYAIAPTEWAAPPMDSLTSVAALSSWFDSTKPKSPHDWFFTGEVDDTTRRRGSWLSNTLVLPGLNIHQALEIDDPKKLDWKDHTFDLRGRHLEGAVFDGANLAKVDMTGAHLEGASLDSAQLQGAALDDAHLQGATLSLANFQGASLERAQLQGALLFATRLQGASLDSARLQGASFGGAELQGASLDSAQLQGASFVAAQLQGASLFSSNLTAARLDTVVLWRAEFGQATLKSMSVRELRWGAGMLGRGDVSIAWGAADYATLKQTIERTMTAGDLKTRALARIERLDCQNRSLQASPCDPKASPPPIAKEINKAGVDDSAYAKALAASLGETICQPDNAAVYILRGLLRYRIEDAGAEAPALVERILSKDCPVSAALTEDDRAKLRDAVKEAAAPAMKSRR